MVAGNPPQLTPAHYHSPIARSDEVPQLITDPDGHNVCVGGVTCVLCDIDSYDRATQPQRSQIRGVFF